jgi:hypothetical protein
MKVKAEDIRIGNCVTAYLNNGRQTCTVKNVLALEQDSIVLTVSTTKHHNRNAGAKVIKFSRNALIDVVG